MKTHEFSIIASGLDPTAEDFESRFYDVGCDDATISFQKGHIIVDFGREAETVEEAIATAVEAVNKAGAKVQRIEPDPLVSLSDMASRAGMTRAAMTNYFKGKRAEGFPTPVAKVTSESPLWDWATVARWMFKHRKLEREIAMAAEIVRQANEAIWKGHVDIGQELRQRAEEYSAELDASERDAA
jgi:AcrR family transcriptional regulator